MTVVRREHRAHFTIIPNSMFLNDRLSIEAKGVLGYLLSRPHKWQVRLEHVGRTLRIGRKKLQRIFRELIGAGYVTREQQRIVAGHRFGEMDYVVRDVPAAPSVDSSAEFLQEYQAEQKRLRAESTRQRREADKRLGALDRQITNIVDAIAEGIATAAMKARLIDMEREKEALSAEMVSFTQVDNVVELHPAAVEAYRKKVTGLQAALTSDAQERREAADIVRSLVTGIDVIPLEGRGQVELRVCGALAELLNLPSRQPGEPPSAAMVVAEERYRLSPHHPILRYCLRSRA